MGWAFCQYHAQNLADRMKPGANVIKLFTVAIYIFFVISWSVCSLKPYLLFVAKARSLPLSAASERFFYRVGSCFPIKQ